GSGYQGERGPVAFVDGYGWGRRVQRGYGVADGVDLGVAGEVTGEQHPVLAAGDDLAVSGDDRTERSAPIVANRFLGESTGLGHELVWGHGAEPVMPPSAPPIGSTHRRRQPSDVAMRRTTSSGSAPISSSVNR